MNENNSNASIGEVLKEINHDRNRGGNIRRRIRYNEETGDFVITEADAPLNDGEQDATGFAEEGFA